MGWDAETYTTAQAHHRLVDDWFLERHRPEPTDVVVDVGCGTGEFTARLAELVPHGHVIGVDRDPDMLRVARGREAPNLTFREGIAQDLDEVCEPGSADLIVSRATLHWLPASELPRCFAAVRAVLRPGGWFHSESAAPGNLGRVLRLTDELAARHGLGPPAAYFADAGEALELLETAGFEIPPEGVRTVAQRRHFDRPSLAEMLRNQVAPAYDGGTQPGRHAAFLDELLDRLEALRRHDGSFDQTFVRLELLARRPA